jgi:cold shock protein
MGQLEKDADPRGTASPFCLVPGGVRRNDEEYALVGAWLNHFALYYTIQRALFDLQEDEMAIGVVKWFNATKGYGFIQPEGGGNDVFVHISAVERAGLSGLGRGTEGFVRTQGRSQARKDQRRKPACISRSRHRVEDR